MNLTRRKKALFLFLYYILLFGIFFAAAELLARWKGYSPWKKPAVSQYIVEPGGRLFQKDSMLGYTSIPGQYKITIPGPYSFKVTNLPNTLRITQPLNDYPSRRRKPQIWIFGCSFAYGWTLNDQETFPYLLQERYPDYEVVNFGVCGYGTVQSLIQFQESVHRQAKPKIAILAYASFHDERNTFLRERRKWVSSANKLGKLFQPCARWGRDKNVHYLSAEVEYQEVPLMRYSAFIHCLEQGYNKIEKKINREHEVSKWIIREFHNLCDKNGVSFVVGGLDTNPDTQEMLRYCKKEGIAAAEISVDFRIKENTNWPYDAHPSARANREYARKLESFLEDMRLITLNRI